jgi:hypothetical protein
MDAKAPGQFGAVGKRPNQISKKLFVVLPSLSTCAAGSLRGLNSQFLSPRLHRLFSNVLGCKSKT